MSVGGQESFAGHTTLLHDPAIHEAEAGYMAGYSDDLSIASALSLRQEDVIVGLRVDRESLAEGLRKQDGHRLLVFSAGCFSPRVGHRGE